jgi:MFS family permease
MSNEELRPVKAERAKKILSRVALFLGELRDGLTMLNMQNAYLVASKGYSEKQAGVLFFVFGMSQFIAQTPAGYLMDYSDRKVQLLGVASVGTTLLTLATAFFAQENGTNINLMIFIKLIQGAITALIPPGLNSITQGIVGSVGMTGQVSQNEMMNHLGTAIIVFCGSCIAYGLYPDIGLLFIVSPIACAGVMYFLGQIKPGDIDHNAARGLTAESSTTNKAESFDSYSAPKIGNSKDGPINEKPSFNFGLDASKDGDDSSLNSNAGPKAETPLTILRDPILLIFVIVCFTFHLSNGTVLPLVMQALAIGNGRSGIFMSGFCIIIAQAFMVVSAHVCGKYSGHYGRKGLFLIGMLSVPIRCAILAMLLSVKENSENAAEAANDYYGRRLEDANQYYDADAAYYGNEDAGAYYGNEDASASGGFLNLLILSTQVLDGVGAGIFGTMYVLVTSDISGGTGRFSLTLGLTTTAMSIGGTVSGYLGQALAEDIGYRQTFVILGFMSLIPAILFFTCMPETLSNKEAQKSEAGKNGMAGIVEEDEHDVNRVYGRLA